MGAASEGGYLGADAQSFFSAVVSGAAGTYVLTLTQDADFGTDLIVRPGQHIFISGDAGLVEAPRWGSGGFTVGEKGSLSLTYATVQGALSATDGGSITLVGLIMPTAVLDEALYHLHGNGSRLVISGIAVAEHMGEGELVGTITASGNTASSNNNPFIREPPDFLRPYFIVVSGPCTTSASGQCVGRWPSGYGPQEECRFSVNGGTGGVLRPCPVWDIDDGDYVIGVNVVNRPHMTRNLATCAGLQLSEGDVLRWHSDSSYQGVDNGGLPRVNAQGDDSLGGGWQMCFY